MAFGDTYNDLFQYVVLYLMEMNEDKLIALSESGGLRMYVARIIYINAKSERSEFNKQYKDRVIYADMFEYEVIDESIFIDVEEELRKEVIYCNSKTFILHLLNCWKYMLNVVHIKRLQIELKYHTRQ